VFVSEMYGAHPSLEQLKMEYVNIERMPPGGEVMVINLGRGHFDYQRMTEQADALQVVLSKGFEMEVQVTPGFERNNVTGVYELVFWVNALRKFNDLMLIWVRQTLRPSHIQHVFAHVTYEKDADGLVTSLGVRAVSSDVDWLLVRAFESQKAREYPNINIQVITHGPDNHEVVAITKHDTTADYRQVSVQRFLSKLMELGDIYIACVSKPAELQPAAA
jgi:hypothetical protein